MEDTPRLYVGNLPYVAQKEDIEQLFHQHTINIKKIDISIDPFTGRNPSYCFVDFHDQDTAQHVLDHMQGVEVRGRPIRINPKTERKTAGERNRLPTKTYDRGWKAKEFATPDVEPGTAYAFDRWNRDDAQSHWTAPAEEGRRVYVGGLPRIPNQDTLNVEMRQLFADFPVQAVSKLISPHHSETSQPGSMHFCYVDLETAIDAKNAVTMLNGNPTPYGGAYKVRPAHKRGGTNIVNREQLGTTAKLFVGNLPEIPSRDDLEAEMRSLFEGYQVKYVSRLISPQNEDKQGNTHHYCFVELPSTEDAQAAVEALDGKEWPSGAVYKIRIARERPAKTDDQQQQQQQQRQRPARRFQDNQSPQVNRNLGGSWRRAD